jgi:predicted HicB family RNase H-like nuclease
MEKEDDGVKLNLRLDEGLHKQLAAEAKRSIRSLNGEIIWRLRQSLAPAGRAGKPESALA